MSKLEYGSRARGSGQGRRWPGRPWPPVIGSLGAAAGPPAAASTSSAPGVTANSITVGTISTQTGPISSNFSSLIYGEKAYFDYINAQGGINGRKIDYKYTLDDGGNPSQFTQLANTLVNQDHVFAVTGVASAFFTPNIFVEAKIPTYGYNVTGNWDGPQEPLRGRRLGAVLPGRGARIRLRGRTRPSDQDRHRGLRRRILGRRLPERPPTA